MTTFFTTRRARLSVLLVRGVVIAAALLAAPRTPIAAENPSPAAEMVAPDPLFDDGPAMTSAVFPDPIEGINRRTLRINRQVDRWLLDPITGLYGFLLPDRIKVSIRQVFTNLNTPAVLANDLLQREWRDAGVTTMRFVVNSTVGVAGLFDPARSMGFQGHDSDFGQTLALVGIDSGPFLVIPGVGPTTARDGFGAIVDFFLNPGMYIVGPAVQLFAGGGRGLAAREANLEALEMLRESSVDYYAALRNAYFQHRTAAIWSRRARHAPEAIAEGAAIMSAAAASADARHVQRRRPSSWRPHGPLS